MISKFKFNWTLPQLISEILLTVIVAIPTYYLIKTAAAGAISKELIIAGIITYLIRSSVVTITWRKD